MSENDLLSSSRITLPALPEKSKAVHPYRFMLEYTSSQPECLEADLDLFRKSKFLESILWVNFHGWEDLGSIRSNFVLCVAVLA